MNRRLSFTNPAADHCCRPVAVWTGIRKFVTGLTVLASVVTAGAGPAQKPGTPTEENPSTGLPKVNPLLRTGNFTENMFFDSFLMLLSSCGPSVAAVTSTPAEAARQLQFLKCWPEIKGFFTEKGREKLELEYQIYLAAEASLSSPYDGAARKKFTTLFWKFMERLGPDLDSRARFLNDEDLTPASFFQLHQVMGSRMTEKEKICAMAYWQNFFELKYDQKRKGRFPPENRTAEDLIRRFHAWMPTGVCGDINGTLARKLAESLGLKMAAYRTNEPRGEGHLASIVVGNESNYLVDYTNAYFLSKNLGVAMDQIDRFYGAYRPFGGGLDRGLVFYKNEPEEFLLNSVGWQDERIRKGTSLDWNCTGGGAFSLKLQHRFRRSTFGLMMLDSRFALENALGGFVNFRAMNVAGEGLAGDTAAGKNEPRWFMPLESADLGVFAARTGDDYYPIVMGKLAPFGFNFWPGRQVSLKFNPYIGEYAINEHPYSICPRHRSKLELRAKINGTNSAHAGAEVAYVYGDEYYTSVTAAFKGTLGYEGNGFALEAFVAPQNLQGRYGLLVAKSLGMLPVVFTADFSTTDLSGKDLTGFLTARVSIDGLARMVGGNADER